MPSDPQSSRHERFLALLQPIQAELEGCARKVVWRAEDLPDVLQNAALRAYGAFNRYREDASFQAWMFKILHNEVFSINRQHARVSRNEVVLNHAQSDTLAELEAAAAYTDWLASPNALRDALDSLNENERQVLHHGLRISTLRRSLSMDSQ